MEALLIICAIVLWTTAFYMIGWDSGFQDAKKIYKNVGEPKI